MKNPEHLHIESLKGLEWRDSDLVLLHAAFQLLKNFVEEELAAFPVSDSRKGSKAVEEIKELYEWWLQRSQLEDEQVIDPIWTAGQYEKDNEMLHRLIGLRKHLWT